MRLTSEIGPIAHYLNRINQASAAAAILRDVNDDAERQLAELTPPSSLNKLSRYLQFFTQIFGKTIKWIPRCGSLMWANMSFVRSKMILYRRKWHEKSLVYCPFFWSFWILTTPYSTPFFCMVNKGKHTNK